MGATALFLAITWLRQAAARSIFVRGAVIALAVAASLGLIVFASAAFVLGTALDQALLAGSVVGAGYLWLNLVTLGIGLWFRPAASWGVGSALATPVILSAIGFGYAAFRAWPLQ